MHAFECNFSEIKLKTFAQSNHILARTSERILEHVYCLPCEICTTKKVHQNLNLQFHSSLYLCVCATSRKIDERKPDLH